MLPHNKANQNKTAYRMMSPLLVKQRWSTWVNGSTEHTRYWWSNHNKTQVQGSNFYIFFPTYCSRTFHHAMDRAAAVTTAWLQLVLKYILTARGNQHIPGTNFTKCLWAHNPNLVCINIVFICKMIIRSCHNFAHVTIAQLSWHVQNCDMIRAMKSKL